MRSFAIAVSIATSASGAATFKYPTIGTNPSSSYKTEFFSSSDYDAAAGDSFQLTTWLYADNFFNEWVADLPSSKTET